MGVFFRRVSWAAALRDSMEAAISPQIDAALRQVPPESEDAISERREELASRAAAGTGAALRRWMEAAVSPHIDAALRQAPPDTEDAISERRDKLASQAADAATAAMTAATSGTMRPNWAAFLVALALFFVLLGFTVFLDWKNMVDDPKVYSGMATAVLGALLGLLTGEAVGTGSSE
jgi:hypothetical protein